MNSHPRRHAVLVSFLSLALLPVAALAQAGLSGDAMSGQTAERLGRNSQFDNGTLRSQSALGQLEEMTGATVDRSSSHTTYSHRVVAPRQSAPRIDTNRMLQQQMAGALAGALVGALFSNLFDDNSAQQRAQAEAEARARAEAEAEAFRVQQELARQARIRQAQRYRAEWDAREHEITDQLGGAFDVAVHPGTAFFGRPANPDADAVAAILGQDVGGDATAAPDVPDSDPDVVDLRDSSLVVTPLRPATPLGPGATAPHTPRWAYDWPATEAPPPLRPPSQLQGLLAHFGPWLGDWYEGVATDAVKETLWSFAEHVPGQDWMKAVYDFNSQRQDLTDEMSESYDPLLELDTSGALNAARSLGSPYSSGAGLADAQFEELQQRGGKVAVDAWSMAFKQFTGHFGGINLREIAPGSDGGSSFPSGEVPNAYALHWRLSALGQGNW
jgi:hypothetical protein